MIEFQYGLYVGKHMNDPLRIKKDGRVRDLVGVRSDHLEVDAVGGGIANAGLPSENIPQLKSLESLTDDEWLWIFGTEKDEDLKIKKNKEYSRTI